MLRHVAVFQWAEGTTTEQVAALCDALGRLPDVIPELRRYRFGADAGLVEGNWDFAVVADLDDVEGWRAYLGNPDHRAVLDTHVRPLLGRRAAIQFTFEP